MSFDSYSVMPYLALHLDGWSFTFNDQAEVARIQRVLTFGSLYQAQNSEGDWVEEFEPFVRCIDAVHSQDLNDPWQLCPKNATKAIPASLEGQPDVVPGLPSIVMTSCEEASKFPVLGMPDPSYCFNGEKTREMSDEDFRVLTDFQQHSNETQAIIDMQQQQVVLSQDGARIS